MDGIEIRKVEIGDAEQILNIYSYYVKNTAVTFEYEVPHIEEFRNRMKKTLLTYPYIAAKYEGRIVGYAYAGSFIGRKAYDWSAEATVYVEKDFCRCGIGQKLYKALEKILADMGITNLYACISVPEIDDEYLTRNSLEFHRHSGFRIAGEFHKCGYKFERWYNMVWAEKIIGVHSEKQSNIISFSQLISDKGYDLNYV